MDINMHDIHGNWLICHNAAINVIPNYPPHRAYRGQHRGFFCISHRFVSQGRGISSFSEPRRLKEAYLYTNNSYSEVPHGRGISENELLIPFKSPPLPVRGVVSTDIDRCIIIILLL